MRCSMTLEEVSLWDLCNEAFLPGPRAGPPCTYSVCKALRSVPGCLQMEFWSQDVLGILSIPSLNLCFYWHETNGWSTLEQKGNQLYCVQQPCSVTLYRNGSLMDSVRFAPEFADVSNKKWWASKRYLVLQYLQWKSGYLSLRWLKSAAFSILASPSVRTNRSDLKCQLKRLYIL